MNQYGRCLLITVHIVTTKLIVNVSYLSKVVKRRNKHGKGTCFRSRLSYSGECKKNCKVIKMSSTDNLRFVMDETSVPYEQNENPFPQTDSDNEFEKMIIRKYNLTTSQESTMKKEAIYINKKAKEYILSYLQYWIDELGRYPTSYRKGIVRAIYNKIDALPVEN